MVNVRKRLLLLLLCVLTAAGCATLKELSTLSARIQDEGYIGISVKHNTSNGFDTLAVTAYRTDEQNADVDALFRLIWDTYAEDVDRVVVTVNDESTSATKAELQAAYGPRKIQPAGGTSGAGHVIAWILVALLLVGGTTAAVIVRRRRRQRTKPPHQPRPYYKEP
ncbi:hypothetical protein ACFFQW_01060 [Umezawaea endophytica]|uniref:Lipoprotein n=1 Tax=Umezawaea endophytica TaxID=1654476 RepID=A0A9X2VHJ4_9PSEU|nr:hypothetical protein [Umezawaea endophytica]MCS7476840.1 hypothetical protein [Umezawaea endophytica]